MRNEPLITWKICVTKYRLFCTLEHLATTLMQKVHSRVLLIATWRPHGEMKGVLRRGDSRAEDGQLNV